MLHLVLLHPWRQYRGLISRYDIKINISIFDVFRLLPSTISVMIKQWVSESIKYYPLKEENLFHSKVVPRCLKFPYSIFSTPSTQSVVVMELFPQTAGNVEEQYHVHLFMSRHHLRQGNYKEAEVHAHQACQFDVVSLSLILRS